MNDENFKKKTNEILKSFVLFNLKTKEKIIYINTEREEGLIFLHLYKIRNEYR